MKNYSTPVVDLVGPASDLIQQFDQGPGDGVVDNTWPCAIASRLEEN